jgi:hypothetical protein
MAVGEYPEVRWTEKPNSSSKKWKKLIQGTFFRGFSTATDAAIKLSASVDACLMCRAGAAQRAIHVLSNRGKFIPESVSWLLKCSNNYVAG